MFQQAVRTPGTVHVEFRAGRMEWDGRIVTPDKRKGKVVLLTAEDEQLMHFQWHDREKNEIVVDLIVINDAYLERIEKCTTGRVYLLRFTSSDKKLFFWLQEPKDDGDADLVKKFNEAIGAKLPEKGSSPPGAGAAAGEAAVASGAAAQAVDPRLRAVLSQFLQSQGTQGARAVPVPLGAVLTSEVLQDLITDADAAAALQALLPEGQRTPEDLADTIASPQLQQSMHSLTQAVHSDQLPVLFASLGLDQSSIAAAAPGSDALELLCRAMEGDKEGSGSAPGDGQGGSDSLPKGD